MKKFLLGTVGLLALGMAAPATAADLAARPYTKAPPPMVAPIYDWTGFYIGANGGWGQSSNCCEFLDAFGVDFADGCRSRSGGLIGGQIGYRWQANQWVFGVEAQGDWADLSASASACIDPLFSTRTTDRWHRPLYRPDRLRLEPSAVLRKGRCGGDEQPL